MVVDFGLIRANIVFEGFDDQSSLELQGEKLYKEGIYIDDLERVR